MFLLIRLMPWMEGLILDRFISALPCILDEFEYSRKHTPVIVIPIPHQLYRTNNTRQTLRQVWSQLHIATHEKKKICPAYFAVYTPQRLWKVFANEISVTSNKFDIGVSHSYLLAGAMLDNIQWAVLFVYMYWLFRSIQLRCWELGMIYHLVLFRYGWKIIK